MSDQEAAEQRALEQEKLREEIKQLRAAGRTKWITPAALATLLPLLAGFGLWIAGEIKQYNQAYIALADRDRLQAQKEQLQDQKDSLNLEVQTLLQLKTHYAAEAERLRRDTAAKQATIDHTYLRGVYTRAETLYSLNHIDGWGPAIEINQLRQQLARQPLADELSVTLNDLLERYEFALQVVDTSRNILKEFDQTSALMPASEWTKELRPMPSGAFSPGRNIMVESYEKTPRYYDVDEGRFLTEEETGSFKR
ncbi:hypothetical protein [Marinobacterium lutimaris]|uniref:Uncharacterized protein n=1 Tax=Marinobacterium lutimaris TaxID=568106 RepID=A0A1H5U079_9GAMM|nr:hypothetical protein [Marinobacterium lutimaris]SEF67838.1 hypothetical protein SAMN05444390_101208 [Marinobacterium lutimaris]